MESDGNVHNAPPPALGSFKFEVIDDDFCIDNFSSSPSLQDFHHLDHLPLIKASSFDTALDPFFHGFDLYEDGNKPYNYDHGSGMAMQSSLNFHGGGGGLLNFGGRRDLFMEIDPMPLSIIAPDESSCVTTDFHNGVKRGGASNKSPALGRRKAKSGKGQWTPEEDRVLIQLVEKYGEKKWSRIAQVVKGRIGKQCRERWHNHLRPDIKKDVWTEEEDRVLIEAHAEIGNKWAEIAKRLPGRTENSIKNHWNATKRRQLSRRKCRTKWPRPSSLLQNYIKSLSSEKGTTCTRSSRNTTTAAAAHTMTATNIASNDDFSEIMDIAADNLVYEMDDVPDFTNFMDHSCLEMELPFDMPPSMHHGLKEDFDFAIGN